MRTTDQAAADILALASANPDTGWACDELADAVDPHDSNGGHRMQRFVVTLCWFFALGLSSSIARGSNEVEVSGSVGFGALSVGVATGQFTINPAVSLVARGDEWFFRAQNTTTFLGATGAKFGVSNALSASGGRYWENVNLSGGLSLSAYVMDVCGPKLCGLMRGIAPGAVARLDLFGPYLAGALGVTLEASATWVDGSANAVWGGFYGAFTAGPILRLLYQKR